MKIHRTFRFRKTLEAIEAMDWEAMRRHHKEEFEQEVRIVCNEEGLDYNDRFQQSIAALKVASVSLKIANEAISERLARSGGTDAPA